MKEEISFMENSINNLIDLEKLDNSLIIEIKYATADNFMGKKLYPINKCILQLETAKKLINANNLAKGLGFKLKVLDAYRPLSVQRLMWETLPDDNFVAPPTRGSKHNRGCAVDVTLVNLEGKELEMPSPFDDFSEKAWITYASAPEHQQKNRELLARIMTESGFQRISTEWWHFNDPEFNRYPLLDVSLESFL
jgi:zinc D-Ala-D-Ala dipeptidase